MRRGDSRGLAQHSSSRRVEYFSDDDSSFSSSYSGSSYTSRDSNSDEDEYVIGHRRVTSSSGAARSSGTFSPREPWMAGQHRQQDATPTTKNTTNSGSPHFLFFRATSDGIGKQHQSPSATTSKGGVGALTSGKKRSVAFDRSPVAGGRGGDFSSGVALDQGITATSVMKIAQDASNEKIREVTVHVVHHYPREMLSAAPGTAREGAAKLQQPLSTQLNRSDNGKQDLLVGPTARQDDDYVLFTVTESGKVVTPAPITAPAPIPTPSAPSASTVVPTAPPAGASASSPPPAAVPAPQGTPRHVAADPTQLSQPHFARTANSSAPQASPTLGRPGTPPRTAPPPPPPPAAAFTTISSGRFAPPGTRPPPPMVRPSVDVRVAPPPPPTPPGAAFR